MGKSIQFILFLGGKILLLFVLLLLLGLFAVALPSPEEGENIFHEREKRELTRLRKQYRKQKLRIQLLELQIKEINKFFRPTAYIKKWKELELARLKLDLQETGFQLAEKKYRELQDALQKRQNSLFTLLKDWFFREGIKYLLFFIFLIFITPFLWALFMYYLIAPLVERFPPLTLSGLPENPERPIFYKADTSCHFLLEGKTLFLRRGDWGKKRNNVSARTRFLWKWQYPLVSFAADLWELIAFSPLPGKEGAVTITSPYGDLFVARIDLNESNGIVIKPSYLVGITEDVEVVTKWSFNLHNILSGRIRQIILKGKGTVFLTGCWGLDVTEPHPGSEHKIEDNLLIAYAAESEYSLTPTETFWHYFRKQTSLFDQKLGKGLFITQNNTNAHPWGPKLTGLEKSIGFFLSGVGKLLGF